VAYTRDRLTDSWRQAYDVKLSWLVCTEARTKHSDCWPCNLSGSPASWPGWAESSPSVCLRFTAGGLPAEWWCGLLPVSHRHTGIALHAAQSTDTTDSNCGLSDEAWCKMGCNYRLLRGARVCFVVTNGHWTGVWFSHRFRFTQTGRSKAEKYKNAQLSLTNLRDVKPCEKFRWWWFQFYVPKIPPVWSYNKFQSSRKSSVYSD